MYNIDIRTIPEWLKNSQFYRTIIENSLNDTDFIVPIDERFITNITIIQDFNELTNIIEVMKFWCIDSVPEIVYDYFIKYNNTIVSYDIESITEFTDFQDEMIIASNLNKENNKIQLVNNIITRKYLKKLSKDGYMNVLKYLQKNGTTTNEELFYNILSRDFKECLEYIALTPELNCMLPQIKHKQIQSLLKTFHNDCINCLVYMTENLKYYDPILIFSAMEYSCNNCIKYLYKYYTPDSFSPENLIFHAIKYNNLELLIYFNQKGIPIKNNDIQYVILSYITNKQNKLDIFSYCVDNCIEITNPETIYKMCLDNKFKEGFYYLLEKGFTVNEVICNTAAANGYLDVLRTLETKGYKLWTEETLKLAGKYAVNNSRQGAEDCLYYLEQRVL
jgi:hypothetical protein